MGRNKDSTIRNFYDYESEVNKSKCKVCQVELSGNHITNLRRHVQVKHVDILNNSLLNCSN